MKQQQKRSLKAQLLSYKRHPGSFIVFLLLCLATLLTAGTFILLLAHIILNGIPNLSLDLFSFEYTSDNASMMPAIINTLSVTLLSLVVAVPVGIFSAIYLTEYARRGNKFVSVVRVTAETLSGIPKIPSFSHRAGVSFGAVETVRNGRSLAAVHQNLHVQPGDSRI